MVLRRAGVGLAPRRVKASVSVGAQGPDTDDQRAAEQKPSERARPCRDEASRVQAFESHQQTLLSVSFDLRRERSGSPQPASPAEGS